MADDTHGTVEVNFDARVATLEFANPGRRGALTPEMLTKLRAEILALEHRRDEISAIVLRGADDIFSSGYSIDRFPDPDSVPIEDDIELLCSAIEGSSFAVIALLDGLAIGAALDVAAACDFRLTTRRCRLGITPAKFGLVYSVAGTARIYRLIGPEWTRRLFFTAELVDGAQAAKIGLVGAVYDDSDALYEATYAFARSLAERAPLSIIGAKRIIAELERHGPDLDADTRTRLHDLRRIAMRSPDCAEARAAFRERRDPVFTGKELP